MSNTPAQQRIVCAANRYLLTGQIVIDIRHFDGLMIKQIDSIRELELNKQGDHDDKWEQGFIDQHGKFLQRTRAWKVAEAAGQIIRRVGGDTANGGTLYSENLY
jgi:DNA-binding PucR family transcriptional regulator